MKIVHISANAPYNDYWGYHENLLPHYHKKMGNDVIVITTNTMHQSGKIVETNCDNYILNDGVRVIRLKKKNYIHSVLTNLSAKLEVYEILVEEKPDFIYFHGVLSSSIFDVIRYKKSINRSCKIVCDNHLDYYNGPKISGLKTKIIRCYYRLKVKLSQKYIDKYYGVTPWRCDFLKDYFKVPSDKIELLVMGGDDENIRLENSLQIRNNIRKKLDIKDDDFVIVSGGKFDRTKNIHLLMKAVEEINNDKIKLIVFGKPTEDIEHEINESAKNVNIRYIGWLPSEETYDYFLAAELAVFPGTHSVLWEQACACGVPCMFKKWDGMYHVDVGGNCIFLKGNSVEEIKTTILEIYENKDQYIIMKNIAKNLCVQKFSYENIARKIIYL